MRSYPQNSPEASARILALAMLADGHLCRSELEALESHQALAQIGSSGPRWREVLNGFCEDLLMSTQGTWEEICRIDPDTLAALLTEIDEPGLQRKLLQLCVQLVDADGHLDDGEALLLAEACRQWGQQDLLVRPPVPVAAA